MDTWFGVGEIVEVEAQDGTALGVIVARPEEGRLYVLPLTPEGTVAVGTRPVNRALSALGWTGRGLDLHREPAGSAPRGRRPEVGDRVQWHGGDLPEPAMVVEWEEGATSATIQPMRLDPQGRWEPNGPLRLVPVVALALDIVHLPGGER